jgi:hypothetical protein
MMLGSDDITVQLARYLLQLKEGDRLQSVRDFAQKHQTSIGTVSNALTSIEASSAIQIERRGHMGSYLISRSVGDLWMLAEQQPLVIAFPLIANPRLEGLATALKKQLREAGLDVYLIFIRGSRTRAKALRENRCHLAVMSRFAAEEVCTPKEQIVFDLPNASYVVGHEVFYRPDLPQDGRVLRVAIDNESTDVSRLTRLEFANQNVEFVPVTFMQLPRLLRDGIVDVGVWSTDDMQRFISPEILFRPFSPHVLEQVGENNTTAVMIASTDHHSVQAVVQTSLDKHALHLIQQQVLNGEIVPEY